MANPWLEWWQGLKAQWTDVEPALILEQLAVFAGVLVLALIVDRVVERWWGRRLGESAQEHPVQSMLRAIKFPLLVLLFGYLALSIYAAAGRPTYLLEKLVSFFWFVAAYALAAKVVAIWMPPGDARSITRRLLLPVLVVVGLLHFSGLLAAWGDWASEPLPVPGTGKITVGKLAAAAGIAAAFWLVAKGGRVLFLRRVLPRTRTDPNLARSVATFVQFGIVVAGFWLAIASLGLPLSSLTLVVSALSVGLGFGLQDVIKNIMGGIILLSEGNLRPNDAFRIGTETGLVERIGLRSTTLRTANGSLVIVPNAILMAEKVIDLSAARRVEIQVRMSCEADPRLAERLLLEIARSHPEVVADPTPSVLFTNLGESTFDFMLQCFVDDRTKVDGVRSDLHHAVVRTFRMHHLEMAYRQLEVHLRSGRGVEGSPSAGVDWRAE